VGVSDLAATLQVTAHYKQLYSAWVCILTHYQHSIRLSEAQSHEVANDADHRFDFAGSADTINEPVIELR